MKEKFVWQTNFPGDEWITAANIYDIKKLFFFRFFFHFVR